MKKLKTGPILKSLCEELGLTNRQVAELINVTASNVGRIFKQDNVNTDTLDRLTEKVGINIYAYLAKKWDELARESNGTVEQPAGDYFKRLPQFSEDAPSKPKISILIELDADRQSEILKMLKL